MSQRCVCAVRPCIRAPTGLEPLIDRPGSPTSCSQPTSVIDSQSGPGRWEAWLGLTEPGASQRVTWRGCGGREAYFQGPPTQVEETVSGEAFTAGWKNGGSCSLQGEIKGHICCCCCCLDRYVEVLGGEENHDGVLLECLRACT